MAEDDVTIFATFDASDMINDMQQASVMYSVVFNRNVSLTIMHRRFTLQRKVFLPAFAAGVVQASLFVAAFSICRPFLPHLIARLVGSEDGIMNLVLYIWYVLYVLYNYRNHKPLLQYYRFFLLTPPPPAAGSRGSSVTAFCWRSCWLGGKPLSYQPCHSESWTNLQ